MTKRAETVFKNVAALYPEDEVLARVDEAKHEYVDEDWDDDFDDFEEAYTETGRGAAESQVLKEVIEGACDCLGIEDLNSDDFCAVFDELKEFWNLNTD